jgi:beta-mannosidase
MSTKKRTQKFLILSFSLILIAILAAFVLVGDFKSFAMHLWDTSNQNKNYVEISIKENWKFRQADKDEWMPAKIPGTVHTDLIQNGVIEDPFYRFNETDIQWIEDKDWEYRTSFSVDKKILQKQVVKLAFDGLDTYADVYLNDQKILEVENMFVGWEVDCKELLVEGENELRIFFHSPVRRGMEKLKKLDYIIPAANEQAPLDERTNVFTRKAPFHYGWDWGPRLVTSGIWRPVSIKAWNHAIIDDVYLVTTSADSTKAEIAIDVDIDAEQEGDYSLTLLINGNSAGEKQQATLNKGSNKLSFAITIDDPKLWWTNGLGEAYLYDFSFELKKNNDLVHQYSLDYGVRTLELVQKPDEIGHTFQFELNGVPVFMKGSNIIPSETLTPAVTKETYQKMIDNTVAANMNMLRVWGGAIYEEDLFYQLCDQNGILVWQDFMFACAMQPGDEAHLKNIELEAEYNIKRLRNHPSLALWCGDNENLMAWNKWGWKERFEPEVADFIWSSYEKIIYDILPSAVERLDPKTSYHASSPSSVNNQLADRKSGDEHDWTIWFGEKRFETFWENVPRFVSEWGLQAFPPMATIESFALPEDFDLNSELMRHRQRSKMEWVSSDFNGNDMIKRYMEWYYDVPEDFERFVYTSQLLQALGYKTAIEAHRSNMPHCMGTLYWQLNDCWPTISWASLDYFYRWKASHYAVKDAFEPIIVTATHEEGVVDVFTISDKLTASQAVLKLELMDFNGNTIFREEKPIVIEPNTANKAFSENMAKWINEIGENKLLLNMTLIAGNETIAENILYFTEPKNLELPKTKVEYQIKPINAGFEITFTSEQLVKNLFIDIPGDDVFITNNFFDLLPQTAKTIEIKTEQRDLVPDNIQLMYLNQ